MPLRNPSILVVDDDENILRMMQRILELEDYRVFTSSNGEDALDAFAVESPDLVLLDIIMPDMNGYSVCQHIRKFSRTPIIMVSVKNNEEEKVYGFDAGADDYVTKPFSVKVLTARVRAVLRRTDLYTKHPEPAFHCGALVIDFSRQRVMVAAREVNPTPIEYAILSYLARNAGFLLTSDQIIENVWGKAYIGATRVLQTNISRLRQKLGDDSRNVRYIVTVPGIGYMMRSDSSFCDSKYCT